MTGAVIREGSSLHECSPPTRKERFTVPAPMHPGVISVDQQADRVVPAHELGTVWVCACGQVFVASPVGYRGYLVTQGPLWARKPCVRWIRRLRHRRAIAEVSS